MKMLMRIILLLFGLTICFESFSQSLESQIKKVLSEPLFIARIKSDPNKQPTILGAGKVLLAASFVNRRTGTIDSDRGQISNSSLTIYYDNGFTAGAHVNNTIKDSFSLFIDTLLYGHRTLIGVKAGQGSKEIVITILGFDNKDPFTFPANFWAIVRTEEEMQQALMVSLSYQKNIK